VALEPGRKLEAKSSDDDDRYRSSSSTSNFKPYNPQQWPFVGVKSLLGTLLLMLALFQTLSELIRELTTRRRKRHALATHI